MTRVSRLSFFAFLMLLVPAVSLAQEGGADPVAAPDANATVAVPRADPASAVAPNAGQAVSGGVLGGTAVAPLAASFGLVPVGIGSLSTAGLLGGAVAAALGGGTGAASTVSTVSTGGQ